MNDVVPITAEAALLQLYQQWRRLAENEGEAIRAQNWTAVAECNARLAALQPRITRLTAEVRLEWRRNGVNLEQKEKELRQIISDLIELGEQNSGSLTAARDTVRKNLDELDSARQNLRRVRRSYSASRPALWNSFS